MRTLILTAAVSTVLASLSPRPAEAARGRGYRDRNFVHLMPHNKRENIAVVPNLGTLPDMSY
jgi:hypothetical protein